MATIAKHDEQHRPLFDKSIPVRVSIGDQCDNTSIRILSFQITIEMQNTQNQKVLKVQITEEVDPFFLFSLCVTETEFHTLKNEQSLLVDFGTFPSKFIELLEHCAACEQDPTPKFIALLSSRNGNTIFNVMETNQFKHLQHISLQFHPGDDSVVKQYLAERLIRFKEKNNQLAMELAETKNMLSSRSSEFSELKKRCGELEYSNSKIVDELTSRHISDVQTKKEEFLSAQQNLRSSLEAEKSKISAESQQMISELQEKRDELSTLNRALLDERLELQNKLRETESTLASHKRELNDCKKEVKQLREENTKLGSAKYEQEQRSYEEKLRSSAAEQKAFAKEETIKQMKSIFDAAKSEKEALQSSLDIYKKNLTNSEEKIRECNAEITKKNELVGQLQTDLRIANEKLKTKEEICSQQYQKLEGFEETVSDLRQKVKRLENEIKSKTNEIEDTKQSLTQTQNRLSESQKLLESNQSVIQWLNRKINDAELGKMPSLQLPTTTSYSSVYQFRPSSTILPSLNNYDPSISTTRTIANNINMNNQFTSSDSLVLDPHTTTTPTTSPSKWSRERLLSLSTRVLPSTSTGYTNSNQSTFASISHSISPNYKPSSSVSQSDMLSRSYKFTSKFPELSTSETLPDVSLAIRQDPTGPSSEDGRTAALNDPTNPLNDSTKPLNDPTNFLNDPTNPLNDPTNSLNDPTYLLSTNPSLHLSSSLYSPSKLKYSSMPSKPTIASPKYHSSNRNRNEFPDPLTQREFSISKELEVPLTLLPRDRFFQQNIHSRSSLHRNYSESKEHPTANESTTWNHHRNLTDQISRISTATPSSYFKTASSPSAKWRDPKTDSKRASI